MAFRFKHRRNTGAGWAVSNSVLLLAEIGVEIDSIPPRFKFGDGVTGWNDLPYVAAVNDAADVPILAPLLDPLPATNVREALLEILNGYDETIDAYDEEVTLYELDVPATTNDGFWPYAHDYAGPWDPAWANVVGWVNMVDLGNQVYDAALAAAHLAATGTNGKVYVTVNGTTYTGAPWDPDNYGGTIYSVLFDPDAAPDWTEWDDAANNGPKDCHLKITRVVHHDAQTVHHLVVPRAENVLMLRVGKTVTVTGGDNFIDWRNADALGDVISSGGTVGTDDSWIDPDNGSIRVPAGLDPAAYMVTVNTQGFGGSESREIILSVGNAPVGGNWGQATKVPSSVPSQQAYGSDNGDQCVLPYVPLEAADYVAVDLFWWDALNSETGFVMATVVKIADVLPSL